MKELEEEVREARSSQVNTAEMVKFSVSSGLGVYMEWRGKSLADEATIREANLTKCLSRTSLCATRFT